MGNLLANLLFVRAAEPPPSAAINWTYLVDSLLQKQAPLRYRFNDHDYDSDGRNILSIGDEEFGGELGVAVDCLGLNPESESVLRIETLLKDQWAFHFPTEPLPRLYPL